MDCYICNPLTTDSNECSLCRFELQPLKDFMQEYTGDPGFNSSSIPFISLASSDKIAITGFIAGAQIPFKLKSVGVNSQLARIATSPFIFVTIADETIAELKRNNKIFATTEKDLHKEISELKCLLGDWLVIEEEGCAEWATLVEETEKVLK